MKNFSEQEGSQSSSNLQSNGLNSHHIVEVDEILKDLIPDFMSRRFQELEEMNQMIVAEDYQGFTQYGHKLKGSSLNYGFNHLGNLAAQLETAAQNRNIAQIRQLVEEIREHIRHVEIVYVE